jgi:hypothetical protein
MAHPMDTQCTVCKENVRKDTLLTHSKKTHPSFLWDSVFCTYKDIDPTNNALRTKRNIRTAISILEDARIPYELDEDIHIDFGSNTTYSTDKTAIKHILDHPAKHRENFLALLKDGLTNEKMIALLQWIIDKPTQVIMDNRIIAEMKLDMQRKEQEYHDAMDHLRERHNHLTKQYAMLREGEEQQQIQELKQQVHEYALENRKLANICKDLQQSVKQFNLSDEELENRNRTNLMTEQKEWDVYEKMKDDLTKKTAKLVASHTKEVEKLTSSADKKESKYKKEIKALKHQVKTLKLKIATPDSDSDSESDSATE